VLGCFDDEMPLRLIGKKTPFGLPVARREEIGK